MVLYILLIYLLIFVKWMVKNKKVCKNFGIEKYLFNNSGQKSWVCGEKIFDKGRTNKIRKNGKRKKRNARLEQIWSIKIRS